MRKRFNTLGRHCAALGALGLLLSVAPLISAAERNDNFRIALPNAYEVTHHQVSEELGGAIVDFAPANQESTSDNFIRLQSYLNEYMPEKLKKQVRNDPRSFSKQLISTRLEKECANFEVSVGKVRHYNQGRHINWWSLCEHSNPKKGYEFERGRIYSADYGTYIYSHYEPRKGKDFKFSVKEVKWFDDYLNNSALCVSGQNCGLEGKIVDKIFIQK